MITIAYLTLTLSGTVAFTAARSPPPSLATCWKSSRLMTPLIPSTKWASDDYSRICITVIIIHGS
jgi:hypothetical protein